jgi:hypothetical protein
VPGCWRPARIGGELVKKTASQHQREAHSNPKPLSSFLPTPTPAPLCFLCALWPPTTLQKRGFQICGNPDRRSFPLIPWAAGSVAKVGAVGEHGEGFQREVQFRRAGLRAAGPREGAFLTFDCGSAFALRAAQGGLSPLRCGASRLRSNHRPVPSQ